MYTVYWYPAAEDDLAEVWLGASSALRAAITAAVHRVDEVLRVDPLDCGESRERMDRLMFDEPLQVVFEVHLDSMQVWVREIRLFRRRQ